MTPNNLLLFISAMITLIALKLFLLDEMEKNFELSFGLPASAVNTLSGFPPTDPRYLPANAANARLRFKGKYSGNKLDGNLLVNRQDAQSYLSASNAAGGFTLPPNYDGKMLNIRGKY